MPAGHSNIKIGGITLTLIPGDYNIYQLSKALEKLVVDADTGYNIGVVYDRITNRLTITTTALEHDELTLVFDSTTPWQQMGFERGTYTLHSEAPLVSNIACNVAPLSSIYIRAIGLMQLNSEESGRESGFSEILAKIPMGYTNPGQVIEFDPPNPAQIVVSASRIDLLELSLTTRDPSSKIDLNGLDWTCSIEIMLDIGSPMDFDQIRDRALKFQLNDSEK